MSLTVADTDRYGRKLAEVRLPDGTLVQETLAREELAVFYKKYSKNCPNAAVVGQAEAQARQQREQGVWGDPQFVMPSDCRHKNK